MFTCVYTRITGELLYIYNQKLVRILVLVPPDVVLLPVFCDCASATIWSSIASLSTWGFTFEYHRWCKLTAVHHHHLSFFLFKLVENASEHFTYYVQISISCASRSAVSLSNPQPIKVFAGVRLGLGVVRRLDNVEAMLSIARCASTRCFLNQKRNNKQSKHH